MAGWWTATHGQAWHSKEAERELAGFKDEEILKAFPEQALPFWRIESYAKKLREK